MKRKIRHATALGAKALEVLATGREARVMGATSRGLFLQTGSFWLCFVSWEPWRGPLTLNVEGSLEGVGSGDPVRLEPGRLEFPGAALEWSPELVWVPAPPPESESSLESRRARARLLLGEAEHQGRQSTLTHLLDAPGPLPALSLLGLGPGLTPSGDDALLGALLLRARRTGLPAGLAKTNQDPALEPGAAGRLQEARRRTTTLSANLLELAARGLADQRLLALADHVNAGAPCDRAFLDWGAHSGTDVLLGMALEDRLLEG